MRELHEIEEDAQKGPAGFSLPAHSQPHAFNKIKAEQTISLFGVRFVVVVSWPLVHCDCYANRSVPNRRRHISKSRRKTRVNTIINQTLNYPQNNSSTLQNPHNFTTTFLVVFLSDFSAIHSFICRAHEQCAQQSHTSHRTAC